MRYLFVFFCCVFLLFSCNSESKPAINNRVAPPDSLVKFRSLDFIVDGKPCLALINVGYKDFRKKKEFPLSLFITINTLEKDIAGHPTANEAIIFNKLESDILSGLALKTCYIGQTTMNGYRDMMFYIASEDHEVVSEKLKIMKQKEKRIKSYTFENDPEWEAVSEFYDAIGSN
jgi:hypothetical protein